MADVATKVEKKIYLGLLGNYLGSFEYLFSLNKWRNYFPIYLGYISLKFGICLKNCLLMWCLQVWRRNRQGPSTLSTALSSRCAKLHLASLVFTRKCFLVHDCDTPWELVPLGDAGCPTCMGRVAFGMQEGFQRGNSCMGKIPQEVINTHTVLETFIGNPG